MCIEMHVHMCNACMDLYVDMCVGMQACLYEHVCTLQGDADIALCELADQ